MVGMEFGSTLQPGYMQLEWVAGGTVGVAADNGLKIEALSHALRCALAQTENLTLGVVDVGSDGRVNIEFVAPVVADAESQPEWAVSVSLTINQSVPIEIPGDVPAPAPRIFQISGIRIRRLGG